MHKKGKEVVERLKSVWKPGSGVNNINNSEKLRVSESNCKRVHRSVGEENMKTGCVKKF